MLDDTLDYDPSSNFNKSLQQSDISHNNQSYVLNDCVKSIDSYLDLKSTKFIKT